MKAKLERLDKVLAAAGLGSRKDVRELIRAGRVRVGGTVVSDPAHKVSAGSDSFEIDGEAVSLTGLTMMLNKPGGLITATEDPRQPTVLDLFPEAVARRIFPAGRLDKETEGLLIVTDDGPLCHKLISPRHGVEKEYVATLDQPVPASLVGEFATGVTLADGYTTRPAGLVIRPDEERVANVTITEGKYHQVRRMFAAHGLHVVALKRVRIGGLWLDQTLAPGEYRPLEDFEIELLFEDPQPSARQETPSSTR